MLQRLKRINQFKELRMNIKEERNVKKRILSLALAGTMLAVSLAGCGSKTTTTPTEGATTAAKAEQPAATDAAAPETEAPKVDDANLSEVEKIIKEAEGMSMEELAKKAIEESNGKTFYGVGNSSRGKSALPLFIEYLQTIDPSYTCLLYTSIVNEQ